MTSSNTEWTLFRWSISFDRSIRPSAREPSIARQCTRIPTFEKLALVLQKSTQSDVNGHCNGNGDSVKHTQKMQKIFQSLTTDLPISSRQPMAAPEELQVLLTGSTGSLGSYLLRELLYNPKVVKVYCLNRGADAAQRQEKSFAEKWLPRAGLSTRAEFIQCNLSQPYLGLPPFSYHKLLENVTHVVT